MERREKERRWLTWSWRQVHNSGQEEDIQIFGGISLLHQEGGDVTPVPAGCGVQRKRKSVWLIYNWTLVFPFRTGRCSSNFPIFLYCYVEKFIVFFLDRTCIIFFDSHIWLQSMLIIQDNHSRLTKQQSYGSNNEWGAMTSLPDKIHPSSNKQGKANTWKNPFTNIHRKYVFKIVDWRVLGVDSG